MKRLLLSLMLVFALSANAGAAEISVPSKVSQGHAFPAAVTDSAPFEAVFAWRGESFRVQALREAENLWKAEMLLAMPMDARGNHALSLTVNGEAQKFSVTAVSVPWPESILKVAPKYVEPPRKVQEQIARDMKNSRQALAVRTEKRWTLLWKRL